MDSVTLSQRLGRSPVRVLTFALSSVRYRFGCVFSPSLVLPCFIVAVCFNLAEVKNN